jgi:hypothetical protein
MTISIIKIWTCDLCGAVAREGEETTPYSDPVIYPPKGWDSNFMVPKEYRRHPQGYDDSVDVCHECVLDPDWSLYKGPETS